MALHADAACVLKVNVHCDACKMKTMEILSSIIGVYSVSIDAEKGLAKIYGEVDPSILVRALARAGKHAELVRLDVKHPQIKENASRSHRHGYNSGTLENSWGNEHVAGTSLPDHGAHYGHEQYYYPNSYHRTSTGYAPSYPHQPGYNPYDDESFNTCSIM